MKINILQVVGTMNRGGAETFLMNALRTVNTEKYNFIFLCYGSDSFDYESEILTLGGSIVRIRDVKEVGLLEHIKDLRRVIRDEKIDIIHAHTYFNSVFSLIAGKLEHTKKRIAHSHTTRSEYKPSLLKKVYFLVSKILINMFATDYVACGKDAGDSLFFGKKFGIITNGIVVENFSFNNKVRMRIRSELGISQDSFVLGHVGRIDVQKNQSFAIDAFNEHVSDDMDAKLLLVGEGVLREEVEKKVKSMKLDGKVLFLGSRSDVSSIYSAMDIFIFPSLREGIPLTLIEAQASGLRCLVSDTIDHDVMVSELVEFASLEDGPKRWSNLLDEYKSKKDIRINTLVGSAYDVKNSINDLKKIYEIKESM